MTTRPSRSRFVHQVAVEKIDTEATDTSSGLAPVMLSSTPNLPCLVVDKGGSRQMGYAQELQRKHVRVLFPDPIAMELGDRLIFGARVLIVDSFRNDVDLDRLWVAECQEEPASAS